MVQNDAINRMIRFNQTLFDNAFEAGVQIQDQAEKLGNSMLEKANFLPGESRKLYDSYLDAFKAGRNNFKTYVDEGYKQAEKMFQ
jgi:hypothetical protein